MHLVDEPVGSRVYRRGRSRPNALHFTGLGVPADGLTSAQTQALSANNAEYNRNSFAKQERMYQIQIEILEETSRDTPSAQALGVRYVEIEGICRELAGSGKAIRDKNLAVLTEQQKTRLAVLEEALRLSPVAREAQGTLLFISASANVPLALASNTFEGPTGGVVQFDFLGLPGCRLGALGIATRPFPAGRNETSRPASN